MSEASTPSLDPAAPRPRSALVNAGWSALGTFWNIAISFVLTPLLIHSLGANHYGVLLLIWSVTGVMGIASFGLGEATLRYVAHHYAEGDLAGVHRVFRSTLTFYVIACGSAAVVLIVGATWFVQWMKVSPDHHQLIGWLLRLSAIGFFCSVLTGGAFIAIPMALHRYDISSKIGMVHGLVRSGGFLVLAVSGFGILSLVIWDLVVQLALLAVLLAVARRLLPSLRPLPSFSMRGFKEILGYSIYSFVTHIFLTMHRETSKLLLGGKIGPSSVAHFGTPDSVANRLYTVVIRGGETLLPRFSATRDPKEVRRLLLDATWASVALCVVVLIPLALVMPDLLRLWISAEFAAQSAAVGQVATFCYFAPAAYSPIAIYFRGTGRPGLVTVVMAVTAITSASACVFLIPRYGVLGAGYAYLLSSIPWFAGLVHGWVHLFGRSSLAWLGRSVLAPLVSGGIILVLGDAARDRIGPMGWIGILTFGTLVTGMAAALVFGADLVFGGDAPSRKVLRRLVDKLQARVRRVTARAAIPSAA